MIHITDAVVRHGAFVAVDGVNLELGSGVTAIIGPNGAGKSTLLAGVGRLLRLDEGAATVDGLDVRTAPTRAIARKLAVLRQDNHVPIRLTVDDLVGFGRFPHGGMRGADDRAHVDRAIRCLGLDAHRTRFLDELSGGQRQRAFLAMALAQDTDHLLLDEPLNNLDPRHAVELMVLLRALAAEREMSIVVVLHDINVAAQFADRVVAMKDGRVVAHGTVDVVVVESVLAELYETAVQVVEVAGRRVVLWDAPDALAVVTAAEATLATWSSSDSTLHPSTSSPM